MQSKIIDCKTISQDLEKNLQKELENLKHLGLLPHFVTILVGNNPASLIYVKNKQKKAATLGIENTLYELDETISEKKLLNIIEKMNNNNKVHGILLQLPLPKNFDTFKIISSISPNKDLDGLNPLNIGYLINKSDQGFIPCTPMACMHILKTIEKNLSSKQAVVLGRSNLVGLPMAHLLINHNATVTIAHSYTKNLEEICKTADILVSAVGIPNLINESHIKENAIVLDVGISKIMIDGKNKIVGDVDTKSVINKVKAVTPVPSGVGLLTISCLMKNVVKATIKNSSHIERARF